MTSIIPAGQIQGLPRAATGRLSLNQQQQVDVEALVAKIHASCSTHIERIQMIVDGAVLAVEQVQDKRIELLEKGPEVEISDVIFDTLLGLALMGVGKALVPITQSIVKELVGTATWYGSKAGNPRFAKVLGMLTRVFDDKGTMSIGSATPADIRRYNSQIRELLTEKLGEAATEKVKEGLGQFSEGQKSKTKTVDLETTDSPGVAMLAAAQAHVSAQRLALRHFEAAMEAVVRSGAATPEDLDEIRSGTSHTALGAEAVEIRDRHKMLYEATIWIHLLAWNGDMKASGLGEIKFANVEQPLKRYLRKRFGKTIERWMKSIAQDAYSASAVKSNPDFGIDLNQFGSVSNETGVGVDKFSPSSFNSLNPTTQDSGLNRFFVALARDLDSVHAEQQEASGFRLSEPVVQKKADQK